MVGGATSGERGLGRALPESAVATATAQPAQYPSQESCAGTGERSAEVAIHYRDHRLPFCEWIAGTDLQTFLETRA